MCCATQCLQFLTCAVYYENFREHMLRTFKYIYFNKNITDCTISILLFSPSHPSHHHLLQTLSCSRCSSWDFFLPAQISKDSPRDLWRLYTLAFLWLWWWLHECMHIWRLIIVYKIWTSHPSTKYQKYFFSQFCTSSSDFTRYTDYAEIIMCTCEEPCSVGCPPLPFKAYSV